MDKNIYKNVGIVVVLFVLVFGFKTASGAWFTLRTKAKISAPSTYPSTPQKTNQTQCYDGSNVLTACSNTTGQDGNYIKGQTRSYTDNGDSTITDNNTGLMWDKCTKGLSGATCATGSATTSTWPLAITYCEASTNAGYSDWRLPNINELQSIADYGRVSPAINITYFPNTVSFYYWSASTFVDSPSGAWGVDFYGGGVSGGHKSNGFYVRCVR